MFAVHINSKHRNDSFVLAEHLVPPNLVAIQVYYLCKFLSCVIFMAERLFPHSQTSLVSSSPYKFCYKTC